MKVTLINYTGHGHPDPLHAARLLIYTKSTRLTQGGATREAIAALSPEEVREQLAYIAGTIRSSWEFVDYTFEITGVTRAFTHQFVRTRTGSFAQQSQRSVGMSAFEDIKPDSVDQDLSANGVWDDVMGDIRAGYERMIQLGIPIQDARGVLPTNVSTNIIAKFNLRTLADLVGKRLNPRAQGEYSAVVYEMITEVQEAHPWVNPFLFPKRSQTPNLDAILRRVLGGATPASLPEVNGALKELDTLKEVWG